MRKTLPLVLVGLAFFAVSCGEKTTGEKVDDAMDSAADKADDMKKDLEVK